AVAAAGVEVDPAPRVAAAVGDLAVDMGGREVERAERRKPRACLGLDRGRADVSDQPAARTPIVEVLGGAARHHPPLRQAGERHPAQGKVWRVYGCGSVGYICGLARDSQWKRNDDGEL